MDSFGREGIVTVVVSNLSLNTLPGHITGRATLAELEAGRAKEQAEADRLREVCSPCSS